MIIIPADGQPSDRRMSLESECLRAPLNSFDRIRLKGSIKTVKITNLSIIKKKRFCMVH